ncbi:MAG: hypothetical protein JJV88_01065 [Sulfurovum sp.]|nr:hypothetical protein [Sulfurovaceae bacterium]
MSKFKVEFTLKQHTPIIHFQSEQSGATLRATELKPKFDKFLKEYAFDGEIPKEFLIDEGKDALDYKVKIEQNISQATLIDKRDPLFFGNMGDDKDKKFKTINKAFKIELFTYKLKLKTILEEHFEAYLANTNFGTRQSKGFGSFYLNKPFDKSLVKYKVYSFKTTDWKKDIGLFYQFIRQGINLPKSTDECPETKFYSKPVIFSYAKNKGWTWDKKAIKSKYFNTILAKQIGCRSGDVLIYKSNKSYLLRDLFGLSSSQQWMSYNKVNIEKENEDIDRFKSPITFKVVDNIVYFWANDTVKKILDKEFTIKAGKGNDSLKLSTPKHFDLDDFFDFTFNELRLNAHINEEFHSSSEYKILNRIFNEIKASK